MSAANTYPLGKLPAHHLARLLARYAPTDPAVILGPGVGEDAAVIAVSPDRYLVAKSDPITFATDEIGWYAVHVNANDVVCTGAEPRWWLATVLLPGGRAFPDLVDTIFAQMDAACTQVGAQLVGGHTEITYGLERPLLVGTMLGEVAPEALVTTGGARPGDRLILTKGIAVEGTALIAREWGKELERWMDPAVLARCAGFLHRPGISVVPDARIATRAAPGAIHAMHDPTEGGVATSLHELALACGCGLVVNQQDLPILDETRLVCDHLSLDPLGLIASGSLLLAVEPGATQSVVRALVSQGIAAAVIGQVLEPGASVALVRDGTAGPLPCFERDELARLYGTEAS